MLFDYDKSRAFWEERAKVRPFKNILLTAMLHDDSSLAAEHRDRSEKNHFFSLVKVDRSMNILDLGGGCGRWALELAKRARKVTLVDFSPGLLGMARQSAKEQSLKNIDFVEATALNFLTDETFDLILIGGVLMYLRDEDLPKIVHKCLSLLSAGGRLVLREGVGLKKRIEEADRYVEGNRCPYSAFWRTAEEYLRVFKDGFLLEQTKPATICPVPFYLFKKILPPRIRQRKLFQNILKGLLTAQNRLDPYLLKYNLALCCNKFFLKLTPKVIMSQFFVFKKC